MNPVNPANSVNPANPVPTQSSIPTSQILVNNAGLLWSSCIAAGSTNVLAQAYFAVIFAGAGPEQKQIWLGICLLVGTFSSLLGVGLAKRWGFGPRSMLAPLWITLAALLLWISLGDVGYAGLYVVFHAVLRFALNGTDQELDRRALLAAGTAQRRSNDAISTGMRFFGMLCGPVWFGWMNTQNPIQFLFVAFLSACAGWAYIQTRQIPNPPISPHISQEPVPIPSQISSQTSQASPQTSSPKSSYIWQHSLLILGAASIYAAYYLLAASILFILRDGRSMTDPAPVAGMLISLVYACAVVTVPSLMALRWTPRWVWMLYAPAVMGFVALGLLTIPDSPLWVWAMMCIFLGVAFAFYMQGYREECSRRTLAGQTKWQALFNNVGNHAALLGFSAILLVGLLTGLGAPALGISQIDLTAYGIAILAGLGALLTALGQRLCTRVGV